MWSWKHPAFSFPLPVRAEKALRGEGTPRLHGHFTTGGIEVSIADGAMKAFIRKADLSRDRAEQRPERYAVGDKVDALVTAFDKAARKVSLSIKAMEIKDEKEAVEQYGSADSGASLGDILGAALAKGKKDE